jgi:hypothetical protein
LWLFSAPNFKLKYLKFLFATALFPPKRTMLVRRVEAGLTIKNMTLLYFLKWLPIFIIPILINFCKPSCFIVLRYNNTAPQVTEIQLFNQNWSRNCIINNNYSTMQTYFALPYHKYQFASKD